MATALERKILRFLRDNGAPPMGVVDTRTMEMALDLPKGGADDTIAALQQQGLVTAVIGQAWLTDEGRDEIGED